ncbi:hypothetical protein G3T14_22590 [Methylobacterium sp. BTF04]|uniref:hypothetical protein n=1 Tax=Methylobacterium sp. BTF04 TaxID=2708300 RepID=UPI0013D00327|nr:hypothetical protein [Methylobacterium sp. BTF04]NEU14851.1 hypothetical protein [Methylobacterium sp. BTF04]
MQDRPEIAKMIAESFEQGATEAKAGGASDVEIARALIGTGLSWWGKAVSAKQLIEELARLTADLAVAANVDLSGDDTEPSSRRAMSLGGYP